MCFEKTRSEAQKGKLYLPVILLWLLALIISPQVTMGENVKKYEDNISITIEPDEIVHNNGMAECSELTIGVFSIHGKLLFEQDFNVKKGINDLIINLNDFKTGMYLIRYSSGGTYQSAEKLIIVK